MCEQLICGQDASHFGTKVVVEDTLPSCIAIGQHSHLEKNPSLIIDCCHFVIGNGNETCY
jgi:hypothetical protein